MLDETANSAQYGGCEGQSVFPIPFPFLESSHVRASVRCAEGRASALVAGVDYAVNRQADGYGELILLRDPLPTGSALVVTRLVPLTQEIPFGARDADSSRAVEEAADKLTMIAQQLQADLERRVAAPETMSAEEFAAALVECVEAARRARSAAVPPPPEAGPAAFLCGDGDGTARWSAGREAAGLLPLMSASQRGVARVADDAGLEIDAGGALRVRSENLISKSNIEARFARIDARLETMKTRIDALAAGAGGEVRDGEVRPDDDGCAPPPRPAQGGLYRLSGTGVYHAEGCRHGGASARTGLSLEEIAARDPAARPCSRCRPPPIGG